jgi:hypothetical protein
MLKALDGKEVSRVPRPEEFARYQHGLGAERLEAVRADLNRIVDEIPPEASGRRTFSSSFLGSKLTPWTGPLKYLYDLAWEILGEDANHVDVEARAALIFGLFIWECIMMRRDEEWVFYDPNLSARDVNREITGKVYFEQ